MEIREEQELRETMPEAQAIGPEQVRRLTVEDLLGCLDI